MGILDLFRRKPSAAGPPAAPDLPLAPTVPIQADAVPEVHAARVLDQLRLLFPDVPEQIQIRLHCDKGMVFIDGLELAAEAACRGQVPRILADDRLLRTAFLSQYLGALLGALGSPPTMFSAHSMVAEPNRLFLMGRQLEVNEDDLLFGRQFMKTLCDADDAIAARQEALRVSFASMGEQVGIEWVRRAGVLRFPRAGLEPVSLRADLLGSFAPTRGTWLWAWANDAYAAEDVSAIRALRDQRGRRPGMRALAEEGMMCTEPFAFAIAHLAAQHLGQLPIWRWPLPTGPQLFFAVKD